jgi:1-pyrroline-5-carboxylate dehydrogenase
MNYITGPGSSLGNELINSPEIDGVTFTGSYAVGMHVYRTFAQGPYPRPTILEMGGKNATIISQQADLGKAASGIVRSAFGLQGQKCSANSRIFVEEPVYDDLVEKIVSLTENLIVGDPTQRDTFMGPVINSSVFAEFQVYSEELTQAGRILTGGKIFTEGDLSKGFFCQPTIAADVPLSHRLWKHEMFLPITMVHPVKNINEAIGLANDSEYGLTAGFYGSETQIETFFDRIEAGVCYANRPQGSTTGAWPGYQPFGGWKASGSTGKNAGGHYYLPLYMHEQSQTKVR